MCAGCGPGMKDGSRHIVDRYYFSYLGGDENFIEYKDGKNSEIVIDSKVEDFLVHEDKIYVARYPVIYGRDDDGALISTLSNNCEYWIIDLIDNSVQGPVDKSQVRLLSRECKWLESKFYN